MTYQHKPAPTPEDMWSVIKKNYDWPMFKTPKEDLTPNPLGEARRVSKPWGYELIVAETPRYTGKLEHLKAGHRISLQYHAADGEYSPAKEETMCLIQGKVLLWVGRTPDELECIDLVPFRGYRIEPPLIHRLEALEDSIVVEFSTPETGRTVRLQDDYARKGVETEEDRTDPNRGWNPSA